MFFHSILHEEHTSMIYRFLQAQMQTPVKGDWIIDVRKNLEELEITDTVDQIQSMSKLKFQKMVNKAVRKNTFKVLTDVKNSHKKVKHIKFENLEMQKYLKSKFLSNYEAKFAFNARCRMLDVKCNFSQSHKELFCPVCKKAENEDTQSHLLVCQSLEEQNTLVSGELKYEHLFSKKTEKQVTMVKILKKQFYRRKNILLKEKENKN